MLLGRFLLLALALGMSLLTVADACEDLDTAPVHELAGQASERKAPEGTLAVMGVVTGVFLEEDELNGFFIQGTERAPDGRPAGLFVYAPSLSQAQRRRIEPGRRLLLEGVADVYRGRPQLAQLQSVRDCGASQAAVHEVRWPPPDPERLEGVLVRLDTPMVVTSTEELLRYGALELTPRRRAFRPTNFFPGEGPQDPDLAKQRLHLDDGRYTSHPRPVPHLSDEGTRRVGARVPALTGILSQAFNAWRLHPTEPPVLKAANPRPEPLPEPSPGTVRVAAFNLGNYFLTLGERGAASRAGLKRQRAKLLAAAEHLRADVLVLSELENRDSVSADFVERLAAATDEPWRLARGGDPGDGALRVVLAYRADRIEPVTPVARDARQVHHRPPLVMGFRPRGGGDPFAIAGIHFKSKGACPERGDTDRGQGCWNERRVEQAEALLEFLKEWRRGPGEGLPVLIAGDLNAYGGEDPVEVLSAAGKVDLIAEHVPWRERYTYIYRGESGYLDHLLAASALAERVAAVHLHPVNADEPRMLAYDADELGRVQADAFRASDHDPVAVDLRLSE